jgi:hypothetical protein
MVIEALIQVFGVILGCAVANYFAPRIFKRPMPKLVYDVEVFGVIFVGSLAFGTTWSLRDVCKFVLTVGATLLVQQWRRQHRARFDLRGNSGDGVSG